MDGRRREFLARVVAECEPGRGGWARSVCVACAGAVAGVDGAALTLRSASSRAEEVLGASDPWAAGLEEIQYTLGEGPAVEAFAVGRPVLVADVRREQVRWPGFADAGTAAGVAAVFAFPLRVGDIALGTLDLYRRRPGGLSADAEADAAALAHLVTLTLLTHVERAGDDELHRVISYQDVNMATGMLAAQLRISLEDAFARLRAHAFAANRSVLAVARDVLARRIPLDRLAG
ncbi:GAF and ANTAR domain-containing protein [Saccharothrix sp. S26]|uniref:GAF and ANTAR domain-containing protein n=1 Tax=Saccharothrix sp. S26 TaxID=2907215 RepID=UPI001F1BE475|nr:GAF and ANTAR domain-containing protein [Saccharothrix sp. S26]MCE6995065.1 GAF and ANTAR domain-containing protein [Saccharothrix sp. S26]